MRCGESRTAFTLLTALLLFGAFSAIAAHQPTVGPVIVDTDMALDDARAITLLARARGIELLAVLTSDGGSSPCDGASRVHRLLEALDSGGVPVGVGASIEAAPPRWRETAGLLDGLVFGETPDCDVLPRAAALARSALDGSPALVTWIALGPLTNLAAVLKRHPEVSGHLRAVYYFGDLPGASSPGWNTERDSEAVDAVIAAGIPLYLIRTPASGGEDVFDEDFSRTLAVFDSPAAAWIGRLHAEPRVRQLMAQGHAGPWDDSAVLAMLVPDAFRSDVVPDHPTVHRLTPDSPAALQHAFYHVLAEDESLTARPNVVLKSVPFTPSDLRSDVAEVAAAIQARHGAEEWTAAVLASEFHRHLGIYSLVGVKMGIRAREVLEASHDELRVVSRAGLRPPLSCLTDGLQVATGASLGRGTIEIDVDSPAPEALFIKGDERLLLTLRKDVKNRIESVVAATVERFGPLTPQYFEEIRRLSIRYWLELDRCEIFDEKPVAAERGGKP